MFFNRPARSIQALSCVYIPEWERVQCLVEVEGGEAAAWVGGGEVKLLGEIGLLCRCKEGGGEGHTYSRRIRWEHMINVFALGI